ncbi:hypothetical protein BDV95DRAFT_496856 [Massariosphaeria phaeospora]|uniref:Roadblock/LAMTOR2 domain-containing protein n=1 Tax=Massariosphaeria phaeospora TaxID=100035 RepID=A0A7C8M4I1_9PLEO|nr:hypothetical protein BDV95DRAFT_496856 [Massariosphaeria phaeospora]
MLHARNVSELLARNVDPQLYPRMFIMSPNGTLMAYSTPTDIKDLRDQAAVISMAWKDHHSSATPQSSPKKDAAAYAAAAAPAVETLTIEFQQNNVIVRAIQPNLLLVLVGSVPPATQGVFKITAESKGDARYPPVEVGEVEARVVEPSRDGDEAVAAGDENAAPKQNAASSIHSTVSQKEKDVKIGVLHIQRKKIDALTEYMRKDFNTKGFVMPDDGNFP